MAGEVQRGPGREFETAPAGSRGGGGETRCRGRRKWVPSRDAGRLYAGRGVDTNVRRVPERSCRESGGRDERSSGRKERQAGQVPLPNVSEMSLSGGWGVGRVGCGGGGGVIPMPGSEWTTWPQVQAELQVVLKDV